MGGGCKSPMLEMLGSRHRRKSALACPFVSLFLVGTFDLVHSRRWLIGIGMILESPSFIPYLPVSALVSRRLFGVIVGCGVCD